MPPGSIFLFPPPDSGSFHLFFHLFHSFLKSIEYLYDHYFKCLSGMLFISISLSSLAVILSCSFIWDIFHCLFILSTSAISSALDNSGLMEKRSYSAL